MRIKVIPGIEDTNCCNCAFYKMTDCGKKREDILVADSVIYQQKDLKETAGQCARYPNRTEVTGDYHCGEFVQDHPHVEDDLVELVYEERAKAMALEAYQLVTGGYKTEEEVFGI